MCDFETEDILRDACQTTGGMSVTGHYAKHSDIETFPQLKVTKTEYGDLVTLEGDYVMKAGKYFRKITGDLEMQSLNTESAGNSGNLSSTGKFKFQQAGNSRQLAGFLEANKNEHLVFILTDADGERRSLGDELLPANIESFNQNTGEKAADEKATSFIASAPGRIPRYYDGIIPLEPTP